MLKKTKQTKKNTKQLTWPPNSANVCLTKSKNLSNLNATVIQAKLSFWLCLQDQRAEKSI